MSVNIARSRLANAVKRSRASGLDPDSRSAVRDARRDLAAEKLSAYIAGIVDAAPPLTDQQKARLVALLTEARGGK